MKSLSDRNLVCKNRARYTFSCKFIVKRNETCKLLAREKLFDGKILPETNLFELIADKKSYCFDSRFETKILSNVSTN